MDQSTANTISTSEGTPQAPNNQILTRAKVLKLKQYLIAQHTMKQCNELIINIKQQTQRLVAYMAMNPSARGISPTEMHLRFKIDIYQRVLCRFRRYLRKISIDLLQNPTPMLRPATLHHYKELTKHFHSNQ